MTKQCLYDVLGAEKGADQDALKKAYRKKVKELHPDRNQDNPDAQAQMSEVNTAYNTLKDETKKAAYDQGGFDALEELENGGGRPERRQTFGDMFEEEFGKASNDKASAPKAAPSILRNRGRRPRRQSGPK